MGERGKKIRIAVFGVILIGITLFTGHTHGLYNAAFLDDEISTEIAYYQLNESAESFFEINSFYNLTPRLLNSNSPLPPNATVTGNWEDGSTWDSGTEPTLSDNVVIPSGVTVTINSSASCNNITIQSGGSLIVSGSNTLTVYGNWTNNGSFTPGSGTVAFSGSSTSISGATTFYDLQVNSGTNLSLGSDLSISNILTMDGDIITNDNDLILLLPNASAMSWNSGSIVGELQRSIGTGGGLGYFFPVGNGTDDTHVTLSFSGISTSGIISISSTTGGYSPQSPYLDYNYSVNNYWTISNSGVNFSSAGALFEFPLGLGSGGTYQPAFYNGSSWVYPTLDSSSGTSVDISGISSLPSSANFVLAQCVSPAAPIADANSFTYDGNSHEATVTLADSNYDVEWYTTSTGATTTSIPSGTNAGTYTAWAESVNTLTGCVSDTRTEVTLTIEKRDLTVTATADDKVYDGNTTATVTLNSNALAGDAVTVSASNGTFDTKNVGTNKTVTADISLSGADAGNYSFNSTATTQADITQASLTVSITAEDKVYDGLTDATVSVSNISGILGSDVVTATASNGDFDTKNVGTNKTVIADISLSGTDAGNYTFNSTATTQADITQASLTVSITAEDKVYDGLTDATVSVSNISGIIGSDAVTATASNGDFDTKNVGTNKTVTADISLSGADAGNYSFNSTATTQADITQASLTVSITAEDKVYDGLTDATVSVSGISGIIGSDTVTATASNGDFDTKNVGTNKTVTADISLSGADAGNYSFNSTATTQADITQASLTVSITAEDKVYDGLTDATVSVSNISGILGSDVVTATASNGDFDTKDVGTNKTVTADISLSGADAGNYSFNSTATTQADITQASLTVSITAEDKVYDGLTDATVSVSGISGIIGSDAVTATASNGDFDTKNVGTNKTVTADISLSGADASNYSFNSTATTQADITQASITASITATDKVYDSTTAATVSVSGSTGIVAGDAVIVSASNGTFDTKNIGTNKTVTADISLSGADAGNYSFNSTATTQADITQASLTVSITAEDKVYDGLTDATVSVSNISGILGSDVVTATASNGDFDTKDVGTNKTVTADISLSGADAGNYSFNSTATTQADITQASLTVSITAEDKVYDGLTDATVSVSGISGIIGSDAVTATASNGDFDTKNVGTNKTVTADISLSGADAGNYTFNSTATAQADITQASLTVSITAEDKVYDGLTDATVSVSGISGIIGSDAVTATASNGDFDTKNVGTNKTVTADISLSGADAGNYTFNSTATAQADITAIELTITAIDDSKTYDGIAYTGGNGVTYSGFISGEDETDLSGTLSYTGTSQGATDVGSYVITPTGLTSINYTFIYLDGNLEITPKTLTPSITADDKCYDGANTVILLSQDLTGVESGDIVSLNVGAATFDNANVGSGKIVTATGLTLNGADASNYVLSTTTTTTTAEIYELPDPTISGSIVVCESTSEIYTTESGMSAYSWNVTGGTISSGSGTNEIVVDWGTAGTGTVSVNYINTNGCTADSPTVITVTLRPTPTATISGGTAVCQNESPLPAITFTNPMALPVTITYEVNGAGTTINLSANSSANVSQATSATGDFEYTLVSVAYQSAPGCSNSIGDSETITVYPTPTVDYIDDKVYCNDVDILATTFSGPISGTSFTWTNSNTAIGLPASGNGNIPAFETANTTTGPISGTITVTPYANGCEGTPFEYTITVRPTLNASISVDNNTVCKDDTESILTFSNPLDLPITITYRKNNVSQTPVNVAANGTATVSVHSSIAGTFTYDLVSAEFQSDPVCDRAISGSVTVTVNPSPTATATPASQTICSTDEINTIVLQSTTPGATFNWVRNNTATVTGIGASGTGDISGALTNTTSAAITVSFTITPTANGCDGVPITATVRVNPTPVATVVPASQERCSGEAISAIIPSSTTSGTTYTWTRDFVDEVTGIGASGSGSIGSSPLVYLTNTTNAPITVTFTITPYANGCPGAPITATVLLNPKPYFEDDMAITICNSEGSFSVTPEDGIDGVIPVGTTYSWSLQSATSGVTGATSGSGSTISGTLSNTTNTVQTVTYAVTPTYASCIGEIFLLVVTVSPDPDIDDLTSSVCSNQTFTISPANGGNGIVPVGTTYSWAEPTVTGGMTGGAAGSAESTISGTLNNPTNTIQTVTYTVTPSSAGCIGSDFTVTVSINPTPEIDPMATTICSDESFSLTPADGTDGVVPAGTTYSWSAPTTSGGITGGTARSGASVINGTLTNTTSTIQTATYTVTPFAGGCEGEDFTVTVTVNPKPVVNVLATTICSGDSFEFTPEDGTDGIIPSGTTYSWSAPSVTGITGTQAGTNASSISGTLTNTTNSSKTVSYTVTPQSGDCVGINFSVIVTVSPMPEIDDIPLSVCSGTAFTISPVNGTNGIVPVGTTYSWSAPTTSGSISGGVAGSDEADISGTLSNSSISEQTAIYAVTPIFGSCTGLPFDVVVTVYPEPSVTIGDDVTVCYGLDSPEITFTNQVDIPVTATYNINGGANFTVDIDALGTSIIPASINEEGTFVYNLVSAAYQAGTGCSTNLGRTATVIVEPITIVGISASPSGTFCYGEEVVFTSLVDNEGNGATYQWQISTDGGASWSDISGETGTTFTSTTLDNADKVKLVVTTYDTPCPDDIESNVLTMTVNPGLTPEVTIYESVNPICAGTEVTFQTDLVINGGTTPTFEWQINGITVGTNSPTITTDTLTQDAQVQLIMTSNAVCAINPATSNTIDLVVNPILPVSVTIAESDNDICDGTSVTFTATPTNGGTNPSYQWKVNGANVGTNSDTYTYVPSDGDDVTVVLTSSEICTSGNPATSNEVSMTVNPNLPVSVTIAEDANDICEGIAVTFTAIPTNGGTSPAYQWYVDGNPVGTDSNTYTYTPADGDLITVELTSSEDCTSGNPATSNTVEMIVNPILPVGVSIVEDVNDVCDGTLVSFTATPVNGGTSPVYQWKVNGIDVGSDSDSYSYEPSDGDFVTVELTSSETCVSGNPATSNTIDMIVNPNLDVSVSVAEVTAVCDGDDVTLTASPTNGGTNPSYQWYVNSSPVGSDSDTYTYTPSDGDVAFVVLTSSETCTNGNPATSNEVTITVNPNLDVSVSVAEVAAVCDGETVTLTATPVNGGTSPAYQWYVNGSPVGTNSDTYTYTPNNGDVAYVVLTSNEICTTGNVANSNEVTIQVDEDITETPDAPTGDDSVCSVAELLNFSVTTVTNATYYDWILPSGWTIVSGEGTANISVDITGVAEGVYDVTVVAMNACNSSLESDPLKVSIGDYATADAGPDQTICFSESSIEISGIAGGAANPAKGTWTTSGSGTFVNENKPATTYTPSAADRATGTITLTFTTEDPKGSCDAATDVLILTIRPELFATISGTETICDGSSSILTFTANPNTVVTYNDGVSDQTISIGTTGTETLDTGALTATTTYTLVSVDWATAPSCAETVSGSATITVEPAAIVDAGIEQTICEDDVANLNGSITGGASTGTWSTTTGGTFDDSSSLTAVYTPSAADIVAGTVTLTLTSTDHAAVCGEVSDDVVITINSLPVVDAGDDQTICEDETVSLSGSVSGSVITGSWTSSGSGSFDNASSLTAVYTPSAADIAAGGVTLTLTSDDPGAICDAVSDELEITINPLPVVAAGTDQTICEGETLTLSGSVSGPVTTGSWTSSGDGSFNNATSLTAVYTPGAADIIAGSVTLTLTSDDPDGPCDVVTDEVEITINALPVVDAGSDLIICEDETVSLSGSITGGVTTGTWTSSGNGSFDNATSLSTIYTPGSEDITAGSVTLRLTSDDPDGSCDAVWEEIIITINPLAVVDAGEDQTICQGDAAILAGSVSGGASSGSWTGGVGTFSPDRNTLDATYTPTTAEVNAGSVTLTLTSNDPDGPCEPVSATTTININKAVVITTQPANVGVCESEEADLSVVAVGTDLTYQWYYSDDTPVSNSSYISGADTETLHFDLVSLDDEGGYYVVVSGADPCLPVTSNTVTLNVDAAITIITLEPKSEEVCEGENVSFNVVADANGAPLNYQWRKDGVDIVGATSSSYTLTNVTPADAGAYDVFIEGQAGFACSSTISETAILVVNTNGTISESGDPLQTRCVNTPISDITYTFGGSATSVVLSGTLPIGVSGSFNGNDYIISGTPTEIGTFDYTVTTTGSLCVNPAMSGTITVNEIGIISLAGGSDTQELCINNPLSTITYSIGGNATGASLTWDDTVPGGINGSYNSSNGLFTISGTPTTAGVYPFTVITAGSPCENPSLSGEITVNEDATLSWTSGDDDQTICVGNPIEDIVFTMGGSATEIILLGQLASGLSGTYSDDTFTISGIPMVSGTINYTVSTTGPCSNDTQSGVIRVDDLPDPGYISPSISTACTTTNTGSLTLQNYSGNIVQWEYSVDAGYSWNPVPNPTTSATYTYTNISQTTWYRALVGNASCPEIYSGSAKVTVIPEFTPTITASGGDVCTGEPVTLIATVPEMVFETEIIAGGHFNVANPDGWRISQNGAVIYPFPASADNQDEGPWAETNGPKVFCGYTYEGDKKFAIVRGPINSTMETPVFDLLASMPSAELTFKHAYEFSSGASGKIEISFDGGNTYTQTLATYTGSLRSGTMPNVVNDVGLDLSPYLGMSNLRIRFNYSSTDCSTWAVDDVSLPAPEPDITYVWGPSSEIIPGSGSVVTVVPPTTTEYTLTVYIAGCPGSATAYIVQVYDYPMVFTSNTCVGVPVKFETDGAAGGTWSVTGGGSIDSEGNFTPTEPGCFEATYMIGTAACSGSSTFVVFPEAQLPDVNEGCGPIVVTPPPTVAGFNIEYSFDGGTTWGANLPPAEDNCDGYHIKTRYITADLCGETPVGEASDCGDNLEVVRVVDTTAPDFTAPADIVLSKDEDCNYDASVSVTGDVTDENDMCSTGLDATYTDEVVTGECEGEVIIYRTWYLADDCGNENVQVQTITIEDNAQPPTFTVPADITIYREADCTYDASVSVTGDVTDATDNCSTILDISYDDVVTEGTCGGEEIITRTWTVADDCGSASVQVQIITVVDNTLPTITCPTDITVECIDDVPEPDISTVTATDNCSGPVTVTHVSDVSDGNTCPEVITRTYRATDSCGNFVECTQTITVTDTTEPTINAPTDLTLEGCDVSVITSSLSYSETLVAITLAEYMAEDGASATDNCGIDYITYIDESDAGSCPETITRTFTVYDLCGNFTSASQIITINDTTNPVIDIEALDAGTDCSTINPDDDPGYQAWLANHGGATATDACDSELDWTNNTALVSWTGDAISNQITVTFRATDDCGNFVETSATYTIIDDQPPYFTSCPTDVEDEITDNGCTLVNADIPDPLFEDACGIESLTYELTGATTYSSNTTGINYASDATFNVGVTTVTYTLTDVAGYTVTCEFNVWIKNLTDPAFEVTCPDNVEADADAGVCGADLIIPVPVIVNPCDEDYRVSNDWASAIDSMNVNGYYEVGETIINWTITDASGNVTTCTQTVTVTDTQAPIFTSCPTDVEDEITDNGCTLVNANIPDPEFEDNCAIESLTYELSGATVYSSDATGINYVSDATFNVGVTHVIYTVTDIHGLTATCEFDVWIKNLTDPAFEVTCPDNVEADADAGVCGADLVIPVPVIVNPCDEDYMVSNDWPSAIDSMNVNGYYEVGETIINWTITDASGNVTTCTQTVTVTDTQAPVFTSCPTDVEDEITDNGCTLVNANIPDPEFEDNCEIESLTYELSGATNYVSDATGINYVSDATFNVGVTHVIYTVTDIHGLTATCEFDVWIKNLTDPAFEVTCPDDVVADADEGLCGAELIIPVPSIYNPCDEEYTVSNDWEFAIDSMNVNGYYEVGETIINWIITDASGNVYTCEQTITVNDLMPTLECPPDYVFNADFEVPYKELIDLDPPTWDDNCPDPVLTWELVPPVGYESNYQAVDLVGTGVYPLQQTFYVGVTTITYTVTDSNDHVVDCSFTVTVIGEPEIECAPDIITDNDPGLCSANLNPGAPTLISGVQPITWTWTIYNPDGDEQASGTYVGSEADPGPSDIGNHNFEVGTSSIVWEACNISGCDDCTQLITVEDHEAPTFTPANLEDCVDYLYSAIFTLTNPNPIEGVDPNLIKNPSPDYMTFEAGDTSLDLTDLDDNCCDLASMTIHWRIDFDDVPDPLSPGDYISHPSISGTGQPSTYGGDIYMWGDGVTFTTVYHSITYWVEDCHGNTSQESSGTIIVTPRPEIIKGN